MITRSFIYTGSLFGEITAIGGYVVDAIANEDSAYTLAFLVAFGALAELIEMAGGIAGFSENIGKRIKSERGVFAWSWILSIITFFDSYFHTIAVGTVLSPLLQKTKGSKEKFAFILSVTSLQFILLIPIATSYLGYMITLVTNNIKGKEIGQRAYMIVAKSVLWNFFSWSMILIALEVTFFGLGFGKWKIGKVNTEDEFTEQHMLKEKNNNQSIEEYPKNRISLIVPVFILLTSTIFFFWWTEKENSPTFLGLHSRSKLGVNRNYSKFRF